jgi:hypothetical protein
MMNYNPRVNVGGAPRSLWVICLPVIGLLLAACAQDSGTPEVGPSLVPLATVTAQMAATAGAEVISAETSESTAVAQAPAAPPTEPVSPQSISVSDQVLHDDGLLSIDRVAANQPGWIVVHADADGRPGDILGYTEIAQGVNQGVAVAVDPLQSTALLHAVLHIDGGNSGVFESPGPDRPVQVDSEPISADFTVDIDVFRPAVTVADQILGDEETVFIDDVVSAQKGWIALHMDDNGQVGPMMAYLPVPAGETTDLTMQFNWRAATPRLHAVLYEDNGRENVLEGPEIDSPVEVDGAPVEVSFLVTTPPDIFVLDQPVVEGNIVVERVVSYGPGWIVVYNDNEGGLGNIIGFGQLADGVNEDIRFQVVEEAVTPLLHLLVHQDLEEVGEFEFPRSDPPVLYHDMVPNPVTFRTDSGNYLVTQDQPLLASSTITVPLVVVDHDAFVVIRAQEDGQPGEIWGLTWVAGGVNRDVQVELAPRLRSDILYAELYIDAASDKRFDYPDGRDTVMQQNRTNIQSWFTLLPVVES